MKIENVRVHKGDYQNKKTRISIFIKDENLLDNLMNRRNRPYEEYRKLLPEIFEKARIENENIKAHWSQYAGCSCGCSPGFILDGDKGKLIFVDITL